MLDFFQAPQMKSGQWPNMGPSGVSLLALRRMSVVKTKSTDQLSSGTDSLALLVFVSPSTFILFDVHDVFCTK